MKNIVLILSLILVSSAFAQKGKVRGQILDGENGEPLFGATVLIKGSTNGSMTDFDGKFSIDVDPGTHTIVVSYVSFASQEIPGIVVKAGGVAVVDTKLKSSAVEGETFTITAKQARNNEAAVTLIKKKSANLVDGISKAELQKKGDNTAAGALKRVTGVSIQSSGNNGGKNVVVRGLGDRYSKTILNGVAIPGLNPDKNSVQVDIFPTNVVDNIIVYKSFTPDLPADFAGGMVDIVTKDFPDSKLLSFSASFSYNPNMHFKSDFLSAPDHGSDVFANGAGSRRNYLSGLRKVPEPFITNSRNSQLEKVTKAFDSEMSSIRGNSLLNQNYSLSYGNQIEKEKNTFGYVLSLGYKMKYTYYDDFQLNTYQNNEVTSINELEVIQEGTGEVGKKEVLWNGMLSTSLKREKSKYSLTFFHTQNGINTATKILQRPDSETADNIVPLEKTNLYYSQRSISNVLLKMKHQLNKKVELNTSISPSLALNKEPDLRQTIFTVDPDNGSYSLAYGEGALINRSWRNLKETNLNAKSDLKWSFDQWSGMKSTLKSGVYFLGKKRDFDVVEYNFRSNIAQNYNGDPNQLFSEEYLFDAQTSPITQEGIYTIGNIDSSNIYTASQTVVAGYIMNELPIDSSLKVTYGARIEKAQMKYTGQRQTILDPSEDIFDNKVVLDELDILPSISLVYSPFKDFNIRSNVSRTLARPSFKEKSGAQIYDAVTQITFQGNLDLVQTYINNYDLRFEKYLKGADIVSISAFYKDFTNPIEVTSLNGTSADNILPQNTDKASVLGVEFEVKKGLDFINEKLKNFSIGTNITFTKSNVEMNDQEYEDRVREARDGQTIDRNRNFQGQAPYLVNSYLSYGNSDKALDINLSYNVQGKNLAVVGLGRIPDVYNNPFHDLSMKISKGFGGGEEAYIKKHKISLSANNILNQKRQRIYSSFNAQDQVFSSYTQGVFVGIGYSYTF